MLIGSLALMPVKPTPSAHTVGQGSARSVTLPNDRRTQNMYCVAEDRVKSHLQVWEVMPSNNVKTRWACLSCGRLYMVTSTG